MSGPAGATDAIPGVEQYARGLQTASKPMFSQPAGGRAARKPDRPMTLLGEQLTAALKETFYAYNNRRTTDNRSAQTTLGPSEIGTPCNRRIAMSLMRVAPVNPGGDGWAAFVGTCVHAGLAEMFVWANADSGRYAVEMPLKFPSGYVPKGTADLLDRTLFMLDDHKVMGQWSRSKLKTDGPSATYRIQAHTYAYGARLKGERVEYVAIIAWPRDLSTLDELYVWTEPYNPAIARDALARVDNMAAEIRAKQDQLVSIYAQGDYPEQTMADINSRIAVDYEIADDCKFCPFHMPGAKDLGSGGCNGRR